jgi:UDP-2,3-diacylglucosamine pyrophosphatase LpxH
MTTVAKGITSGTLPLQYPTTVQDDRRTFAHRRLTEVFEASQEVPFDDSSRIVFFSDCHRGDNSRADAFARNEGLFLHALTHYYLEGFTYIEVGDGDELWKNWRFSDIRHAHGWIFDLLHKFDWQGRLHLIVGNHDIQQGNQRNRVEKEGITADEGLILRHTKTGQRIFIVHGHQADFISDRLRVMSRFVVRHIWKRLQLLGLGSTTSRADSIQKQRKLEQRIIKWAQAQQRRIEERIIGWMQARWQTVICGHTHRPMCAAYGTVPYFNTGSCVYPGYITGLEIQNGEIKSVRWSGRPETRQGKALYLERELMAPPRKLCLFG